jgi:hypothetical protein
MEREGAQRAAIPAYHRNPGILKKYVQPFEHIDFVLTRHRLPQRSPEELESLFQPMQNLLFQPKAGSPSFWGAVNEEIAFRLSENYIHSTRRVFGSHVSRRSFRTIIDKLYGIWTFSHIYRYRNRLKDSNMVSFDHRGDAQVDT